MWSRRRGSVARNGHGLSASSPLWWNRGGTGPSCPGLRTIQTWTQGRTPLFPNPQSKNGLQSLAPSHWQVISLGSASPHKVSLFKCNSSPYRILSSAHPLSIHAGRAGLPSPTPQWTKTQATLTLALSSVWGVTGEHGQCGEECLCKWSKNIRAERESGIFWVKRSCGSCRAGVLASRRLMLWWL